MADRGDRRVVRGEVEGRSFALPCGAYVITSGNDPLRLAQEACRAGAGIIQYREKESSRGNMLAVARSLRECTRQAGAILIINDWLDIALLCEADGVHLGQEDLPLSEVRRWAPAGFLIGVSTHSPGQAREAAAAGADYIGIGPVFATPTKEHYPAVGLGVVGQVTAAVSIPVVAIGGITLENMAEVRQAGANSIAMVRGFAGDTARAVRQVNDFFAGAIP